MTTAIEKSPDSNTCYNAAWKPDQLLDGHKPVKMQSETRESNEEIVTIHRQSKKG